MSPRPRRKRGSTESPHHMSLARSRVSGQIVPKKVLNELRVLRERSPLSAFLFAKALLRQRISPELETRLRADLPALKQDAEQLMDTAVGLLRKGKDPFLVYRVRRRP